MQEFQTRKWQFLFSPGPCVVLPVPETGGNVLGLVVAAQDRELCKLCLCSLDVLVQTLQPHLDEDTVLLTHSISSAGGAQSSEQAQRLPHFGKVRDEKNSPVARASPSSSISKSSSFWERIPTSSPAGSSVEEEASISEAKPTWGSQLPLACVQPCREGPAPGEAGAVSGGRSLCPGQHPQLLPSQPE